MGLRNSEALQSMVIKKKWYVVYTRPRWEKKVAEYLATAEIEYYCPLHKVSRQWSDRIKVIQEPLFKGYVFVYILETEKAAVKKINGILNFVNWLGKPAVVQEEEILNIKRFLNDFEEVTVISDKIKKKDLVKVEAGLLMNYYGTVLEVRGNYAVLNIESMGLGLQATFNTKQLKKMSKG